MNSTVGSCIVASVASLRAVDSNKYAFVTTLGYHRRGDGGNGHYYADSDDVHSQENGGTVIIGADGARWKLLCDSRLSLRAFGAEGDGKADDTEAIQRWLNALTRGSTGYAAVGKYKFTRPLVAPLVSDVSIKGDGPRQTCFVYDGEETDIDLVTIGHENTKIDGWTLEGFNIDSDTKMTGGAALRLNSLKHTNTISHVSFSKVNGQRPQRLWDGIWFNNCSVTTYVGFEISVQNEGVIVNGVSGSDSGADLFLDRGSIIFSSMGIHLAGGYGGLYVGQVLIYGCKKVGYLQDNSRAERGNREIIISDLCVLDACHEYCALIDDRLSNECAMQFNAFISGAGWIQPAKPGDGLYIKSLPNGRVSVGSNHIKHNAGNGITLSDDTVTLRIASTTYIVGNGGWGLYSDTATVNVDNLACYRNNTLGDANSKIKSDR